MLKTGGEKEKSGAGTMGLLLMLITLGALVVTGYWLYTSYTGSLQDFNRKTTEALKKTYSTYLVQELSLQGKGNVSDLDIREGENSVSIVMVRFIDSTAISSLSSALTLQLRKKLIERISQHPSLEELENIYKKELLSEGIETPFRFNMKPFQAPNDTMQGRMYDQFQLTAAFPELHMYVLSTIRDQIIFAILFMFVAVFCAGYILYLVKQQRMLNDMKEQFIRNMTHELKTPLSVLSAINETLLDFEGMKDPRKATQYLLSGKTEIHRLSEMVDRVLHVSQFDKTGRRAEFSNVNLDTLLKSVVENYNPVSHLNITLNCRMNNPVIRGNEPWLITVFTNLLDNSSKYSNDPASVTLEATDTPAEVTITVQDNGWGIAEEDIPRLFERFYRAPSPKVRQVRGTGLGLSFVKEILTAHHASIRVSSVPDQGTLFTIKIPRNG